MFEKQRTTVNDQRCWTVRALDRSGTVRSNQYLNRQIFKQDHGPNTNTKKFQTGKLQQVGNSNDIGIWLLRQGEKPNRWSRAYKYPFIL
jgi:hypothetical protein